MRYAPALKRWWTLYLRKPFVALLATVILVLALAQPVVSLVGDIVLQQYLAVKDRPLSEEDMPKLYELSPLDEEGAARIEAYPAISADETWTICVYFVASDLEDDGENDLSYLTSMLTKEASAENSARKSERRLEHLTRFGEGHLASDFDGRWICLNGEPLYLEVVVSTPSATEYRSRVLYDGKDAYLSISRDRDTDEVRITGVRKVPTSAEDANYMINTRSREEVTFGASITPVYLRENFKSNSIDNVHGREITFGKNTSVRMETLPEGQYLSTAVITDPRGDSYYSAVIASTMERGTMQSWRTDPRFYARAYQ